LKIYHREYIRPAPKFYALLCAICWVPALYFFTSVQKSTDITPAESRNLNEGLLTKKMFFKTDFVLKQSNCCLYCSPCGTFLQARLGETPFPQ
jgi:hypothetical protein